MLAGHCRRPCWQGAAKCCLPWRCHISCAFQAALLCCTGSGTLIEACFACMGALLNPSHGSLRDTSARVLRNLTPALLASGKAGAATAAGRAAQLMRSRTLQFACDALRQSAEAVEAVAAAARNVLLRTPDKADARAAAVGCAVALVKALPRTEQHRFVVFVARLSRTPKVPQRTIAVEMAPQLLSALPSPYDATSAIEPRADTPLQARAGSSTPSASTPSVDSPQGSTATAGEPVGASPAPSNPPTAPAPSTEETANSTPAPWGTVCLAVLTQRCADKAPAVRAKALGLLAAVVNGWLETGSGGDSSAIAHAMALSRQAPQDPSASPMTEDGSYDGSTPSQGVEASGAPFVQRRMAAAAANRDGGLHRALLESSAWAAQQLLAAQRLEADVTPLISLAKRRAADDKATVRKAAVGLLEALLILRARGFGGSTSEAPTQGDLAAFEAACADALVSVRKGALSAVVRLSREQPHEQPVTHLWVTSVLPMVRDMETSLQEAALEAVHEAIFARAAAIGERKSNPHVMTHLRSLLAQLTKEGGVSCSTCLGKSCAVFKAKKRLRGKAVAHGLETIISAEESGSAVHMGSWLVLAEVASQEPAAASWAFLQEAWVQIKKQGGGPHEELVLQVIAAAARSFPDSTATVLCADLLQALQGFSLTPTAAAARIAALASLTTDDRAMREWTQGVMSSAEGVLSGAVGLVGAEGSFSQGAGSASDTVSGLGSERTAAALFAIGELAMLPIVKPGDRLTVLVQALASPTLATPGCSQGPGVSTPPHIQAHAWTALGKLCLRSEPLAKKCLPLFVQQLHASTLPAVRNNIVVALADLCKHYTALVGGHIPRLAACLADPHALIRRQALALLSNLLSKDYVKWRGALFHRFIAALVDEDASVRSLADFLLTDTLATKAPLLAYTHFQESIFVMNACRAGLVGSNAGDSVAAAEGTDALTLLNTPGSEMTHRLAGSSALARSNRETVYKALLTRMAPEHKFETAARLSKDVVGAFCEGGSLSLQEAPEVLRDALSILASPHIKVAASRGGFASASQADLDDLDTQDEASAGQQNKPGAPNAGLANAARRNVLATMMKKFLADDLLPCLLELRGVLSKERSPLTGALNGTLMALLKEHKNELTTLLEGDKQLCSEVLYDITQAERQASDSGTAQQQGAGQAPASTAAAAGSGGSGQHVASPGQPQHRREGGRVSTASRLRPGTPVAAAAAEAVREAMTAGRPASAPTPAALSEVQRRTALPSAAQNRTPLPILSPLATPEQPGNLHTPGSGLRVASGQGDERDESAHTHQGRRVAIQESYKTPGQPLRQAASTPLGTASRFKTPRPAATGSRLRTPATGSTPGRLRTPGSAAAAAVAGAGSTPVSVPRLRPASAQHAPLLDGEQPPTPLMNPSDPALADITMPAAAASNLPTPAKPQWAIPPDTSKPAEGTKTLTPHPSPGGKRAVGGAFGSPVYTLSADAGEQNAPQPAGGEAAPKLGGASQGKEAVKGGQAKGGSRPRKRACKG
ncbi:hypothetical protein WJX73_000161 [Symbiochloris irregularis]|uniref:Condensin complex subunit 1 C-terminal domain-containing protein n=1 Tax=Symbiochloris irregularis TaxID=706552 RepID=A0AAW1P0G1_9CHLO